MYTKTLKQKRDNADFEDGIESSLKDLQHLAELGRLSATLLHEISNPLTSVLLHLEQYEDISSPNLREARRSIMLLRRYVEAARQQVRKESTHKEFRIGPQITQIKRIVMPLASRFNIKLTFNKPPAITIYGDAVKFQQIIVNLVVNAMESYGNQKSDEIKQLVSVNLVQNGYTLEIKVQDAGLGIGLAQMPRVFDPFYSTKAISGHGLGIGLAIVKQNVVNDFRGLISVTSSKRTGTTFTIRIPIRATPRNASAL